MVMIYIDLLNNLSTFYHLFNSSPWKIAIFKNGKPSISMGHGLTMANC